MRTDVERVYRALVAEQAHRPQRGQFVDDPQFGNDIEWSHAERRAMTRIANTIRAEHGLDPVSEADVAAVEQSAAGHSDYTVKYALYVADLARGLPHRR